MTIETDIFSIGNNLELLRLMENKSVDFIYMDPPYNTGRNFGEFEDKFDSMSCYANGFLSPLFMLSQKTLIM